MDAVDISEALQVGRDFISCDAPMDIKWDEFIAREASSVKLPMHIG